MMQRFAVGLAILALLAAPAVWACDKDKAAETVADKSAEAGKEVSLTGFLTDANCGAANASAKGKSCALNCIKNGAKVQLYAQEKLYTLDKVASPETYLGVEVKVTGVLDEATGMIKVKSIEHVKQV
jgi:hypothetical protein